MADDISNICILSSYGRSRNVGILDVGVGLSEVNFIRAFLESSSPLNEDQNTVRNTEIGERLTGNGTLCQIMLDAD